MKQRLQLIIGLFAGIFEARNVFNTYQGWINRADFLYWDPAAHAYYGVKLTAAIQSFNPLNVLSVINEQVLWPPLHSILQLPFMIFFGKNFHASSICSMTFLAIFFMLIVYCYQQLSCDWLGLSVLLVLPLTSPFFLSFGSMPMLEIFGASLAVFSTALYLRQSKLFPLSLTFLFFLKYNYCIYILLTVAVMDGLPYVLKAKPRSKSELIALATPFRIFVIAYIVLLVLILLTGGIKIGSISIRTIGNPLYILYLIFLLRVIFTGNARLIWQKIRHTDWKWFIIPVGIWLLVPIPNRIKTFVSFAVNVSLGSPSPNELSYYTFYFGKLGLYFSSVEILIVCLALSLGVLIFRRNDKKVISMGLFFMLPFILMTLNQNKQERYLYTFVFPIWILSAYSITFIKKWWMHAVPSLVLCALAIYQYNPIKLHDFVSWPFIPSKYEKPVEYIANMAGNFQEIRILGVSNEMSPALLQYHIGKKDDFKMKRKFRRSLEKKLSPNTLIIVIGSGDNPNGLVRMDGNKPLSNKIFDEAIEIKSYVAQ